MCGTSYKKGNIAIHRKLRLSIKNLEQKCQLRNNLIYFRCSILYVTIKALLYFSNLFWESSDIHSESFYCSGVSPVMMMFLSICSNLFAGSFNYC